MNRYRKKKLIILVLILSFTLIVVGCDQNNNEEDNNEENNDVDINETEEEGDNQVFSEEFSSERTEEDYKEELKELVEAEEAGDIFYPARNEIKYPFIPLRDEEDELIGYGTWVRQIIYQHAEDMLAVVSPDPQEPEILQWSPIDTNENHDDLLDEENLEKYKGLTPDQTFDPEVDVISGSTISSNTWFFELRNILAVFRDYGPETEEDDE